MSDFNLVPILPEIFLAICAMGLLIVGVGRGNSSTSIIVGASIAALGLACLLLAGLTDWTSTKVLGGMFVLDSFSGFIKILLLFGLIAALALSVQPLKDQCVARFEYPILVLFAGIGMMIMVSSSNFLILYLGLELQSLSLYVLAAFRRNCLKSAEAGVKYFILGALSSGLLLFGISLIYGFTGTLDFDLVAESLSTLNTAPLGLIFGLVFVLAALAFKISAVPFHMWTPDVYEGAPTNVTALFAMVPKVAAIALLMRLLLDPFAVLADQWVQIIYVVSLGSMVLGALAGLVQKNIKRLLAYSSIGHMGYALMGLVAGTPEGAGAIVLYLLIYMVMSAGVFAVVLAMRRDQIALTGIDDLAGLSRTAPAMAYAMAILMFSMAGIPPLAGFFGKLMVFEAVVAQEFYILAVAGVLSSVVAAYYYLKIVKVMFFDEALDPFDTPEPLMRRVVLTFSVLFVLFFVVKPDALASYVQSVSNALFVVQ